MFRIALIAVGGLLALAAPASAQPNGFVVDGPVTVTGAPRTTSLLENTMISGYSVHAPAPGTQVGSEG